MSAEKRSVPVLFPFIKLREEGCGGIIFNPFLPSEIELANDEFFIASLCTGANSMDDILRRYSENYRTDNGEAVKKVYDTIEKIRNNCALGFNEKLDESCKSSYMFKAMPDKSIAPFVSPKTIIWDVTYLCNLSCAHCLTDSGCRHKKELDTREAMRLIDILDMAGVLYLSLTGGEPFMRSDIIELLTYIADKGMRVDIASNGYCIPEYIFRELRELPVFQIQVSIDGIGIKHDLFRGKEGSFSNACQTLIRLREEGISTSISTTVTAENINHIGELIDLAVNLGCDGYKAIPFLPAGRGIKNQARLFLGKNDSRQLSRILEKKEKELSGKIKISTESTFCFLTNKSVPSESSDCSMICSAGYDTLSIGADGTVYPCPFLRDFPLGNLSDVSLESIWHESPILNDLRSLTKYAMNGPCSECNYAPLHCRGGCRAAAFLISGDLKGSDPMCFRELLD